MKPISGLAATFLVLLASTATAQELYLLCSMDRFFGSGEGDGHQIVVLLDDLSAEPITGSVWDRAISAEVNGASLSNNMLTLFYGRSHNLEINRFSLDAVLEVDTSHLEPPNNVTNIIYTGACEAAERQF